jgi:hypothetical protein
MVGNTNSGDVTLKADPLMILGELHKSFSICPLLPGVAWDVSG